jgi:hypothetical protein
MGESFYPSEAQLGVALPRPPRTSWPWAKRSWIAVLWQGLSGLTMEKHQKWRSSMGICMELGDFSGANGYQSHFSWDLMGFGWEFILVGFEWDFNGI